MLPLILIAAALALIWGIILIQRGGLVGGCLATIAAGSCFGHPFLHVSVVTLDRLLLLAVGVLFVVYRRLAVIRPRSWGKPDVVLAALLLTLCYSTFTHNWRIDGAQPLATLLFFYGMPAGIYWIASQCNLTERTQNWVFGFFALLGVYLALTAICEVQEWSAFVLPRYIMSPEHEEFFGRARGPYLNPIGNGVYLSACLAALCMWWPRTIGWSRALLVAAAGLIGVGVLCTLTRSVWLGAGMMMVVWATLVAPKQHRGRVLLVACLLAVAVVAIKGSSLMEFKRDKYVSASEMTRSAELRPILAAYAYEILRDHPLAGVGFGQYPHANIDYVVRRSFNVPMERGKEFLQHNVFLSLLSETGLIGVTLFTILVSLWCLDGWRLWKRPDLPFWQRQQGLFSLLVLTSYLPNALFHEVSIIPMLNMLVFFVVGLARGATPPETVGAEIAK